MSAFNEGCKGAYIEQAAWNCSKVREKLRRDIDAHVTLVRNAKLFVLTFVYEEKLNKALFEPVKALLDDASDDTWPTIRRLLERETKTVLSGFASTLSSFDIDHTTVEKLLAKLEEYAKSIVESKAREVAGRVLMYMKDRFSTSFSRDFDSLPRIWTGKEDIKAIAKIARSASLKLLSVIAAIRLDGDKDNVEDTLQLALIDIPSSSTSNRSIQSLNPLVCSMWKDVPSTRTLITPVQCKLLWRQFEVETDYTVTGYCCSGYCCSGN